MERNVQRAGKREKTMTGRINMEEKERKENGQGCCSTCCYGLASIKIGYERIKQIAEEGSKQNTREIVGDERSWFTNKFMYE